MGSFEFSVLRRPPETVDFGTRVESSPEACSRRSGINVRECGDRFLVPLMYVILAQKHFQSLFAVRMADGQEKGFSQ